MPGGTEVLSTGFVTSTRSAGLSVISPKLRLSKKGQVSGPPPLHESHAVPVGWNLFVPAEICASSASPNERHASESRVAMFPVGGFDDLHGRVVVLELRSGSRMSCTSFGVVPGVNVSATAI